MAVVLDANDVVGVVGVVVAEVQQDFQLNSGLVLELLLVSNDLDSDNFLGLVVEALQGLTKAALAEEVNDFEPEGDLVLEHYVVVSSLVVIPEVEGVGLGALDFFCFEAQEKDLLVVEDLALFILGQALSFQEVLQYLGARDRQR